MHRRQPAAGASGSSVNDAEVQKFQQLARDWWDPHGSSAALHAMNPLRTCFIRDTLCHPDGCVTAAMPHTCCANVQLKSRSVPPLLPPKQASSGMCCSLMV